MKGIKLLFAAAALTLGVTAAHARQLTPEEALSAVPSGMLPASTRSSSTDLVYTQKAGALNLAYIWASQDGHGYSVISADDVLPPVLGYADSGSFDPNNIPPAMEAWLEEYGRQLQYAVSNGLSYGGTRATADHSAISPLLKSQWAQNAPYSNQTPTYGTSHSPTGCIATAFAQAAYFHKWPKKGTGSNTYTDSRSGQTLTFNFANTTFDWDNMLDSYSGSYTDAQANAVSTLMLASGNAALMMYGASSSGAYAYDAVYGYVNFLGYDKGVVMHLRDYYTHNEWDTLVYDELAAGRPVVYGGATASNAGHAFVVDGYSSNGYYHLNWGWGGMSDGYFLLSALDPAEQGTGGSDDGYDYLQDAIIGLKPAESGSEAQLVIYHEGDLATDKTSYSSTDNMTVKFTNGYVEYFTLEDKTISLGLNLVSSRGRSTFIGTSSQTLKSYYGQGGYGSISSSFTLSCSGMPTTSGEYTATPAYKVGDTVYEIKGAVGCVNQLKITVASSKITIEQVAVTQKLTATNIKADTAIYPGQKCQVSATITNDGDDYLGEIYPVLVNSSNTEVASFSAINISLAPGDSRSYTFEGTFRTSANKSPDLGTYYLNIKDKSGNLIGTSVQVEVVSVNSGVDEISVDENTPVEYYTLQGVRIENPTSGVYIRKQGSEVKKVVIK